MLLTHVVDVYREKRTGDKLGFDTRILTGALVNIQPASSETTIIAGGAFGKTYQMFGEVTTSGIQESDKVVIMSGTSFNGRHFIVKGVNNWVIGAGLDHMEFTLFESNE